jgi:hypothetical protein
MDVAIASELETVFLSTVEILDEVFPSSVMNLVGLVSVSTKYSGS